MGREESRLYPPINNHSVEDKTFAAFQMNGFAQEAVDAKSSWRCRRAWSGRPKAVIDYTKVRCSAASPKWIVRTRADKRTVQSRTCGTERTVLVSIP